MENNQETDVSDDQNVSIKMPTSPPRSKKVAFKDEVEVAYDKTAKSGTKSSTHDANLNPPAETPVLPVSSPKSAKTKAIGYKSFKTFVSRPEIKFAVFCAKLDSKLQKEPKTSPPEIHAGVADHVSASRYFDALEGPELNTLKPSEQIMLPEDQEWPFLLRYPVTTFGICLGVSSQAMLWKNLASNTSTEFLNISPEVNRVLWFISVLLFAVVASTYLLKMILYFKAVQREYYHPVRINFFFAPWVVLLFLTIGVPPSITTKLPPFLWYVLMAPIFFLELKLYGQWMSGGKRRLSKVANPSNHLSVVGNFVGAYLGATMGLKEGPLFFFAVGLAHYTVLFVTLYQRLPTAQTLPKDLHPVFFLFVAGPSVGSMAWSKLSGSFDFGSRIIYFIALFLYFSLAFRIHFFRGFKFSLTWWAYTFPMTGAAIATIKYADEVSTLASRILLVTLSGIAIVVVFYLFLVTILHAIMYQDLFPNDYSIAINTTKAKTECKWPNPGSSNSDTKSDTKDWKVSETTQDSCAFPREK
ncbi:voltage-dependent anion channel [Tanacetum coccineum]